MTTETPIVPPTTQPIISASIPQSTIPPGTIPSSYAGYNGISHQNPVTKKIELSVPARFIDTLSYVAKSPIHGLGCFAKKNLRSGEFIEEVSAIILDTTTKNNKDWVITRYLFTWPCENNDPICNEHGPTFFVPTGNAMLYNHADNPNCYWIYDKAMKRLFMAALRDISENEELTWYYGHGYAERLRNESNTNSTTKKGCSACEERKRQTELYKQMQQTNTPQGTQEKRLYSQMSKINRSKIFSNMSTDAPAPTDPIEFRSMVVPENKINDTIQDG